MEQDVPQTPVTNPRILNLGCGFKKFIGTNAVNVDFMANCVPDILWDLNVAPWPWAENESFDLIRALHVFEHLTDWWPAFCECARVLKVGGLLEVRVPDESSATALTYRDHHSAFTINSFHGIMDNEKVPHRSGTNAWALSLDGTVPFKIIFYAQVPFKRYDWMINWAPWLLKFCAAHLRNFIWEQVFVFKKIIPDATVSGVVGRLPDRGGQ